MGRTGSPARLETADARPRRPLQVQQGQYKGSKSASCYKNAVGLLKKYPSIGQVQLRTRTDTNEINANIRPADVAGCVTLGDEFVTELCDSYSYHVEQVHWLNVMLNHLDDDLCVVAGSSIVSDGTWKSDGTFDDESFSAVVTYYCQRPPCSNCANTIDWLQACVRIQFNPVIIIKG